MPPRIVLIHYHLRPGGVTSVVRRQGLALLDAGCEVTVVSGEAAPVDWPGQLAPEVLPMLGYGPERGDTRDLPVLVESLRRLGGDHGVLHFHNPTLGKNSLFPSLVTRLAESGQPMLLQVHDFAEDGRRHLLENRPDTGSWYPSASHVRWLTLNPRDATVLTSAGLDAADVHVLPNPVAAPDLWPETPRDPRLILYPGRGLRRKNLGEFLLLSSLAPAGWKFALTLPPESPRQALSHARWQKWARALHLPVELSAGRPGACPAWCLSTSVQEGFGLAWAEPWLAGVPVTGRWLPSATGHWTTMGWQNPATYSALTVPTSWVDKADLRRRIATEIGDELRTQRVGAILRAHFSANRVDFGRLPEFWQRRVMRHVLSGGAQALRWVSPTGAESTIPEWFRQLEEGPGTAVEINRRLAAEWFAPGLVARQIIDHANAVLNSPADLRGYASSSKVGEAFSRPEDFHFLRSLP